MATWTSMTARTVGDLITEADFDALQDNLTFLLGMGNITIQSHDASGNYTTTSTSLTPVDSTNLSVAQTVYGGPVEMEFMCSVSADTAATEVILSFEIDGTDETYGHGLLWVLIQDTNEFVPMTVRFIKEGLSNASHTIRPSWRVDANTGQLKSDSSKQQAVFTVKAH